MNHQHADHVKQMIEFIRCEMEKVLQDYVGEDNTRYTQDAINKKLSGLIEPYIVPEDTSLWSVAFMEDLEIYKDEFNNFRVKDKDEPRRN